MPQGLCRSALSRMGTTTESGRKRHFRHIYRVAFGAVLLLVVFVFSSKSHLDRHFSTEDVLSVLPSWRHLGTKSNSLLTSLAQPQSSLTRMSTPDDVRLLQNDQDGDGDVDADDAICDLTNALSNSKDDRCTFIRTTDECDAEGFVEYSQFYFCDNVPSALVIIILIVLMLYYFFLIGEVAEDYFAPTMAGISEVLHLPHNVAGVTFLAIANGAPDLFSGVVALTGSSVNLGLAALLGAGVFVSAVVVGLCCLVAPNAQLTRRPMMRDASFLLGTVIYVLVLVLTQKVTSFEAAVLLIIYVIYVITVVVGRIVYVRMKANRAKALDDSEVLYNPLTNGTLANPDKDDEEEDEDEDTQYPPGYKNSYLSNKSWARTLSRGHHLRSQSWAVSKNGFDDRSRGMSELVPTSFDGRRPATGMNGTHGLRKADFASQRSMSEDVRSSRSNSVAGSEVAQKKTNGVNGTNGVGGEKRVSLLMDQGKDLDDGADTQDEEEEDDGPVGKFFFIVGWPWHKLWRLTVPLLDQEKWNRWLCILQAPLCPLFFYGAITGFKFSFDSFADGLKVSIPIIIAVAGLALGFVTWFLSRKEPEVPRLVPVFLIFAFATAAVWIFLVSSELVSLLTTLGLISGIDQDVLGLTLLAWGNAIPDTIANTTVAKAGYPQMALGAAFGEPLANHLLAIGVAMVINTSTSTFLIPRTDNVFICAIFEIIVLVSHLIAFPIMRFQLQKGYAYYLFTVYGVFIVVSVLAATDVFTIFES